MSEFSDKSALYFKARYILRLRACFSGPAAEPGQLPEQEDRHHRRRSEGKQTSLCLSGLRIRTDLSGWIPNAVPDPDVKIAL